MEMLHQAGELLDAQGRDFLDDADQTLSGREQAGVQPAPAERLHDRGRVLARELRRLALARISLRNRIDWQDLSELEGRALEARFDSLLSIRPAQGAVEPEIIEVDRLLRTVDVRTRQIGGLARLEDLMARKRWDPRWCRDCERAIDDLGGVRQERARRLRDDARALARLKRAEHATGLAERAYLDDYTPETRLTEAVVDILPAVESRGAAADAAPLLAATADFYDGLARAAAPDASIAERTRVIGALDQNRAVDFDAPVYAEHVQRLRFLMLEQLVARGAEPDSLPQVCFAGGDRQDHLDFLQARQAGVDAATWNELADQFGDPYLSRWARHRSASLLAASERQQQDFAADLASLRRQRAALLSAATTGSRCGPLWQDLAGDAVAMRTRYNHVFTDSLAGASAWVQLGNLALALERVPSLALDGVTVRLDRNVADTVQQVVVELQIGDGVPLRTAPFELGPAAPAGTGTVGSLDVDWIVAVSAGTPIQIRVLDADGGMEIAGFASTGWLADWDPLDLRGLDSGAGVRVTWRLARPYWEGLVLPELEDRTES
jgi:hypothetical protein